MKNICTMKTHFTTIYAAAMILSAFSCSTTEPETPGQQPGPGTEFSLTDENGSTDTEYGYWTEEHELHIEADGNWNIALQDGEWIEFKNTKTGEWEKLSSFSGTGNQTVGFRTTANSRFSDNKATVRLEVSGQSKQLTITQEASPDMITLLEDEMLRMAASTSLFIYGMDADEDGKISASEAEMEPEEGVPYGIDAGSWGVKSLKGIENFPRIRHIDLNSSPELTEVDLSRNPDIMSVHVYNCPALEKLEISECTQLLELGADFRTFIQVLPVIESLKAQIHTLGIFNRQDGEPSELDFTGYSNLNRLHINDNHLTSVKLEGCTSLWRFIASGNDFAELDLSDVDQYQDNYYMMDNCPKLKTVYVWKGWTEDYYTIFSYDKENGIQFIEKD